MTPPPKGCWTLEFADRIKAMLPGAYFATDYGISRARCLYRVARAMGIRISLRKTVSGHLRVYRVS